ncbi:surface-adhesin E family protein [Pseudomonas sp. nanlin1]|uniref:surface-adhesin E family protein n=1 Tax=Pseudomonas sp. nanlin1 TaxID=3040605 RepID=UPI00388DF9E9
MHTPFMQRSLALLAIAVLAGCASQPEAPAPAPAPNPQGARLLSDTLALAPVPASLLREGDTLNYSVLQADGDTHYLAQVEAACDGSSATLLYLDGARRIYLGSADGKYVPGSRIPAEQLQALKANDAFKQACATTPRPDWRAVKVEGQGEWTLLDRASLQRDGTTVRFWSAFDLPSTELEPPYDAPFAQRRERYAADCQAQSWRLLGLYDVDQNQIVTDGKLFPLAEPQPFSKADPEQQALFAVACAAPGKAAQLPPFKPRNKAPVALQTKGVNAGVLMAIKRLNLPAATVPLHRVVETGTATLKGKSKPLREEKLFSVDPATGQMAVRTRGDGYDSSEVSFRGLFALVDTTLFKGDGQSMNNSSGLTSLSFKGDWKTMPVGAELSYSHQGVTTNSVVGEYGKALIVERCSVEAEVPASTLSARLQGVAKRLSCSAEGDEHKRVDTVYYLPNHGWFFKASTAPNDFYFDRRQLQAVEG